MQRCFIVHARLTRSPILREIVAKLVGDENQILLTAAHEEAIDLATDATLRGVQQIVAVGGDGTVHQVVNGVLRARELHRCQNSPTIAIIPLGSGNDLARYYNMRANCDEIVDRLRKQRTQCVDVLELEYVGHNAETERRYCINVADVGLGGLVSRIAVNRRSIPNAALRYALSVIEGMIRFRKQAVVLEMDNEQWSGMCMSVCMANFVYFGGGMGIAPTARPDDARASLTIIGNVSLLDYFRQLPALRACRALRHPQVFYRETTSLRLSSDVSLPLEIDGEWVGSTPVHMRVRPAAIDLVI